MRWENKGNDKEVLDEIIESASELPPEKQNWILEIAKGMAFTRSCLSGGDDLKKVFAKQDDSEER